MSSDTDSKQKPSEYHIPLLRDLPAASHPPTRVTRDTDLKEAITIMMGNDFSQLPVMQGDRTVDGYISWRSIGEAFAVGKECKLVRDCMASPAKILEDGEPLLNAVKIIAEADFVLVKNREQRIIGLVTTSDITCAFHELAEPFFLLGSIENSIRRLIDNHFNQPQIQAAKDPADEHRTVRTASDLTFGEYVRLFENESNWEQLGSWRVSRTQFVAYLSEVKDIRNDIMHFRPSGVPPEQVLVLCNRARFLEQLQDYG